MARCIFYTEITGDCSFLDKSKDSLLSQSYTDWVWYIIDKSSDCLCWDQINSYSQEDSRIIPVKSSPHSDYAVNWLDAISAQKDPEYMAWINCGDMYHKDFLSEMVNFSLENGLDIAGCGSNYTDGYSGDFLFSRSIPSIIIENPNQVATHYPHYHQFMRNLWGKLYKISAIVDWDIGLIPSSFLQAQEAMATIIFNCGKRVGFNSTILHDHYIYSTPLQIATEDIFAYDEFIYNLNKDYLINHCQSIPPNCLYYINELHLNLLQNSLDYIIHSTTSNSDKIHLITKLSKLDFIENLPTYHNNSSFHQLSPLIDKLFTTCLDYLLEVDTVDSDILLDYCSAGVFFSQGNEDYRDYFNSIALDSTHLPECPINNAPLNEEIPPIAHEPLAEIITLLSNCSKATQFSPELWETVNNLSHKLIQLVGNENTVAQHHRDLQETTPNPNYFMELYPIWLLNINLTLGKNLTKDCSKSTALSYINYIKDNNITYNELYTVIEDWLQHNSQLYPREIFDIAYSFIKANPSLSAITKLHPHYIYNDKTEFIPRISCPICGGSGSPYATAFTYKDMDFTSEDIPINLWLACGSCGDTYKIYHNPQSKEDTYSKITPINPLATSPINNHHNLLRYASLLEQICHHTSGDNLLTLGVGSGELLAVAMEFGLAVEAVEPNNHTGQSISDILNIDINCCNLDNLHHSGSYSIIVAEDIIHTLNSPNETLSKIHSLLKDDGVLWLSTANYNSGYSRMTKQYSPIWNSSSSQVCYSYTGLAELLKSAGFMVVDYKLSQQKPSYMELIIKKV